MLSKYCGEIADSYGTKVGGAKKLIPNLGDKVEYIVHYRNLFYYLLVNDKKKYLKIIYKPNFISQKIIDKIFVAVHCSKKVLTLNKPIYVGFYILDL